MKNKIYSIEDLTQIVEGHKREGRTIVTTNGSFDILHYAHVNLFQKAKEEGDVLITLLNSDKSIQRFKGHTRPIIPERERALMVAALGCVDYVTIFEEDTPLRYLEAIKPHVHVKGGSYILNRISEEKDMIEKYGGVFKSFELEEGYSTTNIINEILSRHNSNK